jgi:subtilisin family serine protease
MKSWKLMLALGAMVGCADESIGVEEQAVASRYIVSCQSALPANFAAKAAQNGDAIRHKFDAAGFAVVSTSKPNSYASAGCWVVADSVGEWVAPPQTFAAPAVVNPPFVVDDDFFFFLQWGHDAVNAQEAWAAGHRGAGVRVAVLDTGFDLTHPDLAGNINHGLSASFTSEPLQFVGTPENGFFSHGTHTAGTVAALDNGFGVIGVAPSAELVLVKVLGDAGSGSNGDVLAGMIHATNVDADIISMSLGMTFPKWGLHGENRIISIFNRVAMYARQRGSTIIAAVGNDNLNLDGEWTVLPGGAAGVVGIAATAPSDWARNPTGSLDLRASYSNYGSSAVDLAGPGGDFDLPGEDPCVVGFIAAPCWVFDMTLSTNAGGWTFAAGTSMATPHVAGVAALILGEGSITTPAQLEAALRARSTDLGQPGNDPFYGAGRASTGY